MPTEATPGILKSGQIQDPLASARDIRYQSAESIPQVTKVDKDALLGQVEGSAEFRIASRLTAESEQLLARQGPLWDEMIRNTQLPILEGMGALARGNAEAIRKAVQRGGSARREGMAAMVQMQEQAKINSRRVSMIAESRVSLDKWARENAKSVLDFNNSWAENVAGVRESYNIAMDNASELMLQSAIPKMMEATENAINYRKEASAKQRATTNRWINGALAVGSLAVAYFTGGATLPLAAGFAGKALGGETEETNKGLSRGIEETAGILGQRWSDRETSTIYPGGATYPARG
jgi:hypothetical protein